MFNWKRHSGNKALSLRGWWWDISQRRTQGDVICWHTETQSRQKSIYCFKIGYFMIKFLCILWSRKHWIKVSKLCFDKKHDPWKQNFQWGHGKVMTFEDLRLTYRHRKSQENHYYCDIYLFFVLFFEQTITRETLNIPEKQFTRIR